MKSTIFFLALICFSFLSCSKYSGPEFNSGGTGSAAGGGSEGEEGGGSGGPDLSKFSFKLDGEQFAGSLPYKTKKVVNGAKTTINLAYEFKRNGQDYIFGINLNDYTGIGKYIGAETQAEVVNTISFFQKNADFTKDTVWGPMDFPHNFTIDVISEDAKYVEANFSGSIQITQITDGVMNNLGTVAITDGNIKVQFER